MVYIPESSLNILWEPPHDCRRHGAISGPSSPGFLRVWMLCARCRQCPPHGTDSWCLACSGVESLRTELAGRWATPGLRKVAEELVISATRGVVALRELSASLESAGRSRAAPPPPPVPRGEAAGERPRSSRVCETSRERPAEVAKREQEDEEEYDEEEEEEEEREEDTVRSPSIKGMKAKSDPSRKPPEPPYPPRGAASQIDNSGERPRSRSLERRKHLNRSEGKKKRRGARGGSRHPRLYRTLDDPSLRVHRKPPRSFWEQERPFAGHRPREERRGDAGGRR